MKKPKIDSKGIILSEKYLTSEFTDYVGMEHKFVVCAVVVKHDWELVLASKISDELCVPATERNNDGHVTHSVYLGVSICNPADSFNEDIGRKIAYNKALSCKLPQRWVASDTRILTNPDVVNALMLAEAQQVQDYPQDYIVGYDAARDKYENLKEVTVQFQKLTDTDKDIVAQGMDGKDLIHLAAMADILKEFGVVPSHLSESDNG